MWISLFSGRTKQCADKRKEDGREGKRKRGREGERLLYLCRRLVHLLMDVPPTGSKRFHCRCRNRLLGGLSTMPRWIVRWRALLSKASRITWKFEQLRNLVSSRRCGCLAERWRNNISGFKYQRALAMSTRLSECLNFGLDCSGHVEFSLRQLSGLQCALGN